MHVTSTLLVVSFAGIVTVVGPFSLASHLSDRGPKE